MTETNIDKQGLLISRSRYLEAGVHIGTKIKTGSMRQFIYRRRHDKIYVLDITSIDKTIKEVAKKIATINPEEILITASRTYSGIAGAKFKSIFNCNLMTGRFVPGALTNPTRNDFTEPELLIVCDPKGEHQAIKEANRVGVPVIGLCDTDSNIKGIDIVLPCNNKGRKSLALIFYLIARELQMTSGKIKSYDEFKVRQTDFEQFEVLEEYEEQKNKVEDKVIEELKKDNKEEVKTEEKVKEKIVIKKVTKEDIIKAKEDKKVAKEEDKKETKEDKVTKKEDKKEAKEDKKETKEENKKVVKEEDKKTDVKGKKE